MQKQTKAHMMELNTVTVHEVKGSFIVYIPKVWAKQMNLKKGDKITWSVPEGNHEILILKKVVNNENYV